MTSLPDDFSVVADQSDAPIRVKKRGFPVAASLGWLACMGLIAGQAYFLLYQKPALEQSYVESVARHDQAIQTLTSEIGALSETAKRLDAHQKQLDDMAANLGQLSLKQNTVTDLRTDIEALRARIDDLGVRFKAASEARERVIVKATRANASPKVPSPTVKIYSMRGANELRAVTLINDQGQISPPLMPGDSWQGARIISIGGGGAVLNRNGKDERITL